MSSSREKAEIRAINRGKEKSIAFMLIPPYFNRHVYYLEVTTKSLAY